ncbi:hypothetical protein H8356DRAFT_1327088 [Neocallimastix lanati (nom. inval.)]|nr:hypothetical protein H8356DRAFT_1327088 [Neocallimastix sp. JGI-2020a]
MRCSGCNIKKSSRNYGIFHNIIGFGWLEITIPVEEVRPDNYLEYNNSNFINYLKNNGIIFNHSTPGLADRTDQSLEKSKNYKIYLYGKNVMKIVENKNIQKGINLLDQVWSLEVFVKLEEFITTVPIPYNRNRLQINIKVVYSNAILDEKFYVQILIGDKNFFCGKSGLLQKALYGLKQAGRQKVNKIIGININKTNKVYKINQKDCIEKMLINYNINNTRIAKTPPCINEKLEDRIDRIPIICIIKNKTRNSICNKSNCKIFEDLTEADLNAIQRTIQSIIKCRKCQCRGDVKYCSCVCNYTIVLNVKIILFNSIICEKLKIVNNAKLL